jgi:squalene-hopene/tetraprenyl-beta-curcumene cyclase
MIGEEPTHPWARKGAAWLRSVQNDDGGWGELPRSYDDPATKGRGPSTASQTAWAVLGLIACGDSGSSAARRGVDFLLQTQQADGSWREDYWTGTGFPRVFYLRYHMYPVYFPLLALGRFAAATAGSPTRVRPTAFPVPEHRDGDGAHAP